MRYIFTSFLVLLLLAGRWVFGTSTETKLTVHFFGSSTCGECLEIKESILKPLQKKYPETVNIQIHDVENEDDFALLLHYEEVFNITENSPQTLILPDTFMTGFESIMSDGEELIEHYLQNPQKWQAITSDSVISDSAIQGKNWKDRYTSHKTTVFEYIRDLGYCLIGLILFLFRRKKFAVICSQILLGLVFIYAASDKLFNPHELMVIIRAYNILPEFLVTIAGYSMPWYELIAALSLLCGIFPRFGAFSIILLHIAFIPALTYRMVQNALTQSVSMFQISFECGCGLGENLAWVLIVRDCGYVLMGILVFVANKKQTWNIVPYIRHKIVHQK